MKFSLGFNELLMQQTMANYDQSGYNNWSSPQGQQAPPSYNFDMPEQFGGEL